MSHLYSTLPSPMIGVITALEWYPTYDPHQFEQPKRVELVYPIQIGCQMVIQTLDSDSYITQTSKVLGFRSQCGSNKVYIRTRDSIYCFEEEMVSSP